MHSKRESSRVVQVRDRQVNGLRVHAVGARGVKRVVGVDASCERLQTIRRVPVTSEQQVSSSVELVGTRTNQTRKVM